MNDGVNRKHGYEMFVYTVRGYVKNVNRQGTQISFNVEPTIPHVSVENVDGDIKPSITLVGRRLIKTEQGMKQADDIFSVLQSTTFVCTSAPIGIRDGDCYELHIEEPEAQRIKLLMTDPNLVVNVAGMLRNGVAL